MDFEHVKLVRFIPKAAPTPFKDKHKLLNALELHSKGTVRIHFKSKLLVPERSLCTLLYRQYSVGGTPFTDVLCSQIISISTKLNLS